MLSNQPCPVCAGLGFALCYTPAIVMVGCYFRRRTALAYGIGMSGSGIGTFVLAPVVQLLIDLYSWRGALLVLSAFVANLCVCGALLRPIRLQNLKEEEESGEEKTTGKKQKFLNLLRVNTSKCLIFMIMRNVKLIFHQKTQCKLMCIRTRTPKQAQIPLRLLKVCFITSISATQATFFF